MTFHEYDNLPEDVKILIEKSFWNYLRDTNRALTSPEQKREFLADIEWRVDTGLSYFKHPKYNPQR